MSLIFCLRCQTKRDDPNAIKIAMKNKRPALKGKCPVCGATLFQLGG